MPEFKLPVHVETYTMLFGEDVLEYKGLVDADGLEVDLQDVADALNATATTPAPDLTALEEAFQGYLDAHKKFRAAPSWDDGAEWEKVRDKEGDIVDRVAEQVGALFGYRWDRDWHRWRKDGTP